MYYLDEDSKTGPVMLLLHGMPNLIVSIAEAQRFATRCLWIYNGERRNMALQGITPKQKLAMVA